MTWTVDDYDWEHVDTLTASPGTTTTVCINADRGVRHAVLVSHDCTHMRAEGRREVIVKRKMPAGAIAMTKGPFRFGFTADDEKVVLTLTIARMK